MDPNEILMQKQDYMYHNHMEILPSEPDTGKIRVMLTPQSLSVRGFVHGGLMMSMADSAAGVACRSDGRDWVTQNMNMSFISNCTEGVLLAEGKVIHRGFRVAVVQVDVTDENGRLISQGTCNMYCASRKK